MVGHFLRTLVAIARGAGIANSHWCDEAQFDELISRRFDDGGPVLLAAKIDKPGTGRASALDG